MPDQDMREKVIKGLECCTRPGNCGTCPWYPSDKAEEGCIRTLMKGMLTLLKAQEQEAVDAPKPDSDIGCWYDITHNYTLEQVVSALKAQEPRVMTLSEIKDYLADPDGDKKPLWLEWSTIPALSGWVLASQVSDLMKRYMDSYNTTWRPWTSRPDEKRREETPWE